MIGMAMSGEHASDRLAAQWPVEQRQPEPARDRIVDAGVDQREAVAILDQIDVDVVEPERQRQPQPEYARRRLDPFERFWRRGMREL